MAITIVVKECAPGSPKTCGLGQARLLRYIGECAVAIVAVEHVSAIVRYKKVLKAVIIVISNCH